MNDRKSPEEGPVDPRVTIAEVYAKYKDGIREVSLGLYPTTSQRLIYVLVSLVVGVTTITLAVRNCPTHAVVGLGVYLLSAGFEVARLNAKNREERANESVNARIGTADTNSA